MNKSELVNAIAEKTGFTKADATRAVDAYQDAVIEGVQKYGKVTITGFTTWTSKKKEAKQGRNPRTGEPVNIPARTVVSIKAGSKLKDAVN